MAEEKAIIAWLLRNAHPTAETFLPQLDRALAEADCPCGCPTISIYVPPGTPRAPLNRSPLAEAFAHSGPYQIGVLLFQAGGYLTCLEFYDLSDIPHPYGAPDPSTLELAHWPERPSD